MSLHVKLPEGKEKLLRAERILEKRLRFLGAVGLLSMLSIAVAFGGWPWWGWSITWRLLVTSLVVILFSQLFSKGLSKALDEVKKILGDG